MAKSWKEFWTSFGKWWWVVVADYMLGLAGVYQTITNRATLPKIAWGIAFVLAFAIPPFIAFHTLRVDRDKLRIQLRVQLKAKPDVWIRRMCIEIVNMPSDKNIAWRIAVAFNVSVANMSHEMPLNIRGILLQLHQKINPNDTRIRPHIGKPPGGEESFSQFRAGTIGSNLYLQPNESIEGILLFVDERERFAEEHEPYYTDSEILPTEMTILLIDNKGKEYRFPVTNLTEK